MDDQEGFADAEALPLIVGAEQMRERRAVQKLARRIEQQRERRGGQRSPLDTIDRLPPVQPHEQRDRDERLRSRRCEAKRVPGDQHGEAMYHAGRGELAMERRGGRRSGIDLCRIAATDVRAGGHRRPASPSRAATCRNRNAAAC